MSHVPLYLDLLGLPLDKCPGFLVRFGELETKLLTYDIEDREITAPVFISGLARSGSTVLLEILDSHPDATSFRYGDYPFIHVNYFWNTLRALIPGPSRKVERAHKDRLMVNVQSPEALDEILWMSFFDHLHDPAQTNALDEDDSNADFERYYKDSIRKLLALRKSGRFVTKNNYNAARLPYLHKIFPDARFVIPIRRPEAHVYSLMKQNKLFRAAQENDARSRRYMRRHGHFEFGLDFRPVNFGDDAARTKIQRLWEKGSYAEAYAHLWAQTYGHVWDVLQDSEDLQDACAIIRYDDLCAAPQDVIARLLSFCDLPDNGLSTAWREKISAPDYYDVDLSDEERQMIRDITQETENLYWTL